MCYPPLPSLTRMLVTTSLASTSSPSPPPLSWNLYCSSISLCRSSCKHWSLLRIFLHNRSNEDDGRPWADHHRRHARAVCTGHALCLSKAVYEGTHQPILGLGRPHGSFLVMLLCYSAICSYAATEGYGRHAEVLGGEQAAVAAKITIIGQTFCIIGIATSKACVAFFLLRIVVFVWHQIVLWVCVVAIAIICVLCALFDFIRCNPVAAVWNPTLEAKCWMGTEAFTDLSVGVGITSVICDFVLALLPWAILWNLNMKKKEKRLIGISMSLGVFAGASGIVRAIELKRLSGRSDYTYESVSPILWSSTELCITLCTACMPMLRPLYNKIRGKSSTDGYEQYDKAGSGATPAQGISLDNVGNNSNKRRKGSTKMGLNETTLGGTVMDTWIDHTKRQGSDEDILIN